jgi:hypothetical protein
MASELPARPLALIKAPARFGDTPLAASWSEWLRQPRSLVTWLAMDSYNHEPPARTTALGATAARQAQPPPKFGAASRRRSIRNDLKRAIGEPNPILAVKCHTNAHGDGPGPPCPGSGEALNNSPRCHGRHGLDFSWIHWGLKSVLRMRAPSNSPLSALISFAETPIAPLTLMTKLITR